METGTNKEKWINEVLESTSGMHRAMPPGDLHASIMARLQRPGSSVNTTPFPLKQWAAAAVLLLAVNITSVLYFTTHTKNQERSSNPVSSVLEMDTYNY